MINNCKDKCMKTPCEIKEEILKILGREYIPGQTVDADLNEMKKIINDAITLKVFEITDSLDKMTSFNKLYVLGRTNELFVRIDNGVGGYLIKLGGSQGAPTETDPLYTSDKPNIQTVSDVRLRPIVVNGKVVDAILDVSDDVTFLHNYITSINTLVADRLAELQDMDTDIKNDLIQSINDRILLEEIFDVRIKNLEKTNIGGEILTTNQGESFTDALDRMIPEPTENQLAYISDGNELRLYQNKGAIVGDTYIIDWQLIHTFGATVTAGISSEEANARFVDKTTYNANKNATDTKLEQTSDKADNLATSLAGKQPKTDPNLHTASKDTTGSINEVLDIAKKSSMIPMEISTKPDGDYYHSESELPAPSENEVGKIYIVPLGEGMGIDYYLYTSQYNQQTKQYTYNRYKFPFLDEYGTWIHRAYDVVMEVELVLYDYYPTPIDPSTLGSGNIKKPSVINITSGNLPDGTYYNAGTYIYTEIGLEVVSLASNSLHNRITYVIEETYKLNGKMALGELIILSQMQNIIGDIVDEKLTHKNIGFTYWSPVGGLFNAQGRFSNKPNHQLDTSDFTLGLLDEMASNKLIARDIPSLESLDVFNPLAILTSGITVNVLKGSSNLQTLPTEHPPADVDDFTIYISSKDSVAYMKFRESWHNDAYTSAILYLCNLDSSISDAITQAHQDAPSSVKLQLKRDFMMLVDMIGNLITIDPTDSSRKAIVEIGNALSQASTLPDGTIDYSDTTQLFDGKWPDLIKYVASVKDTLLDAKEPLHGLRLNIGSEPTDEEKAFITELFQNTDGIDNYRWWLGGAGFNGKQPIQVSSLERVNRDYAELQRYLNVTINTDYNTLAELQATTLDVRIAPTFLSSVFHIPNDGYYYYDKTTRNFKKSNFNWLRIEDEFVGYDPNIIDNYIGSVLSSLDKILKDDKFIINSSGSTSTNTAQQLAGLLDVLTNLFSKSNSNLGMGGISIDSNGHVLEGTTNTGKNIIEYLKGGGDTVVVPHYTFQNINPEKVAIYNLTDTPSFEVGDRITYNIVNTADRKYNVTGTFYVDSKNNAYFDTYKIIDGDTMINVEFAPNLSLFITQIDIKTGHTQDIPDNIARGFTVPKLIISK